MQINKINPSYVRQTSFAAKSDKRDVVLPLAVMGFVYAALLAKNAYDLKFDYTDLKIMDNATLARKAFKDVEVAKKPDGSFGARIRVGTDSYILHYKELEEGAMEGDIALANHSNISSEKFKITRNQDSIKVEVGEEVFTVLSQFGEFVVLDKDGNRVNKGVDAAAPLLPAFFAASMAYLISNRSRKD